MPVDPSELAVKNEFDSNASDQSLDGTGRYKQKWRMQVIVSGVVVTIETHEYLGPKGAGFIQWAERKLDSGKRYRMGRHTGPETRSIPAVWTELIDDL